MKLFIVESPGKVKNIQGFLGSGWKVAASVGHVRDLPERELGVSVPDYAPTERGKDVLKRLAALVEEAEAVYLATDPDREGEAIAWHLQDALKLKKPCLKYAASAPQRAGRWRTSPASGNPKTALRRLMKLFVLRILRWRRPVKRRTKRRSTA
jgi:DNA topoisomerase IA